MKCAPVGNKCPSLEHLIPAKQTSQRDPYEPIKIMHIVSSVHQPSYQSLISQPRSQNTCGETDFLVIFMQRFTNTRFCTFVFVARNMLLGMREKNKLV